MMCQPTPVTKEVPASLQMQKTSSLTSISSSGSTSKHIIQNNSTKDTATQSSTFSNIKSFLISLLLASLLSIIILEFALWLPYQVPGLYEASIQTYIPAWYNYDIKNTKFDNSNWTYGTDYILTIVMFYLAYKCYFAKAPSNYPKGIIKNKNSFKLRAYSSSLLLCYGISTLAGGYSHQTFTSVDMLNTMKFRIFWIICVGNVSFASCYMGLIGREVQRIFGVRDTIPLGPWWFWPVYGTYMVATCAMGYISFKRPACDIFIAGITQFPSTFYCLGALWLRKWAKTAEDKNNESPIDLVRLPYRMMYYIGFIGNAPLLPMYPVLVQYSGMSLAGVNTLLHTWLMVMWGMQGISLMHLCNCMSSYKLKSATD